jgi:hypothetical protein
MVDTRTPAEFRLFERVAMISPATRDSFLISATTGWVSVWVLVAFIKAILF